MVIIANYELEYNSNTNVYVVRSDYIHDCPTCRCQMKYRDSKIRTYKIAGGIRNRLYIRRFTCVRCGTYHTELPDILIPYKHYTAAIIEGVITGTIDPYDLETEDYPTELTMRRWIHSNLLHSL